MKKRDTWVQNSLVRRRKLPTRVSMAQRRVRNQRWIDDKADTRIGAVCSIGNVGEKSGQADLVVREQGEAGSGKGEIGVSMGVPSSSWQGTRCWVRCVKESYQCRPRLPLCG